MLQQRQKEQELKAYYKDKLREEENKRKEAERIAKAEQREADQIKQTLMQERAVAIR